MAVRSKRGPLRSAEPEVTNDGTPIVSERRGAVARLTINRPPLNILDLATLEAFQSRLDEAVNAEGVRLVEIRGAGRKAFSAGNEVRDHFPERAPEMLRRFHALLRAVLFSRLPTVGVVRGHCLGGGLELALSCDFVLASTDARLGVPEIKLGTFPPAAAVLLPLIIGEKRALEMILSGESLSAEEAQRRGLVYQVAPADQLEEKVEKLEGLLLAYSPLVVALARKAARVGSRPAFEAALRECERIYREELLPAEDATEGLKAFLEKRAPVWRGK